jgi:hypothetical protein
LGHVRRVPTARPLPSEPMRRLHVSATLTAVAAIALGGCAGQAPTSAGGFQGAEREVAQVVDELQDAGRKGKPDEICSRIFGGDFAASLKTGSVACVDEVQAAIQDVNDFQLEVTDVTVTGSTARAQVRQGDDGRTATFAFAREGDGWRVTSLGA